MNHDDQVNKVDNFLKSLPCPAGFKRTLYEQVIDNAFSVEPAYAIKLKNNFYVVPGDRKMPELDYEIINDESISSPSFNMGFFHNQKSARPYHSIMRTAEHFKID